MLPTRRPPEWYRLVALKQDGGLPKRFWQGYKPTKTGWTADVMNEKLLKSYD